MHLKIDYMEFIMEKSESKNIVLIGNYVMVKLLYYYRLFSNL